MSVIQILLVDDFIPWHNFIRETLESEHDLTIAATAIDGLGAVQKATELQPDIILMDLGLPGLNGIEATRQIRMTSPASKILFLSADCTFDAFEPAFQVGASGYVLKWDADVDLLAGIRSILRGEQFISRSLGGRLPPR
jgi:DNA-binding NarL/FixJ family response regulator